MTELYPIKFEPILKDKIWGGDLLVKNYGKKADPSRLIGESWEISAVQDNLSVVSNGFLAGNNIQEIIEVYMSDFTGEAVFDKFGVEFPLLIKLIEAKQDLSVQVHPDNKLANERHKAYGKTEMWYVLEAEPGTRLYTGFKHPITKDIYNEAINNGSIVNILNVENVVPGDAFYIPAGRVHSIGAGSVLAEIQQTSDITYRIFDWNRMDNNGNPRELHQELALDAIDYKAAGKSRISKVITPDKTETLVSCSYFHTNLLYFNSFIRKDYNFIDSFVIYICISGEFVIHWDQGVEIICKGETVLIPAMITDVVLEPRPEARILEIFINNRKIT